MTATPRPVDSDATIDADIRRYEEEHGDLGEHVRAQARVARRLELLEPNRTQRHPLGNGADPAEDQCTPKNRHELKASLWAYYAGTLATQINQRRDTATGLELADRIVSLMEIGTALKLLGMKYDKMEYLLERIYRDHWTPDQVCQADHHGPAEYYRRLTTAVDHLIIVIYDDFVAAKRVVGEA